MMREIHDFCEEPAILAQSMEALAMPYPYRKGRFLEGCSRHSWALEERVEVPAAQCTSGCSLLVCRRSQASALNLGVRRMCTVVCASVGGILRCLAGWGNNVMLKLVFSCRMVKIWYWAVFPPVTARSCELGLLEAAGWTALWGWAAVALDH